MIKLKKLLFLIILTLILIPSKTYALNNICDNYIVMDIDSKRILEEKNKEISEEKETINELEVKINALEKIL